MKNRRIVISVIATISLFISTGVFAQNYPDRPRGLRWSGFLLSRDAEWYTSDEARQIADNVLLYQSEVGAWPKNTNLAAKPESQEALKKITEGENGNTIDNGATTTPMRYLALVYKATGEVRYKDAFIRGLDYLFEAQYDNGGWPQFYPLRDHGYYSEITYNDNAMINVMYLLRAISDKDDPYTFIDVNRIEEASIAIEKGVDCILKTQVKEGGKLTVWCAQYDQNTLEPAWARAYEPPSLSGSESVNIVRYLMEIDQPSPEIIEAVEGAVAWFEATKITGLKYRRGRAADGQWDAWVEEDPEAGPIWARFYELETNKPIFLGRDSQVHYTFAEIERERRTGYGYYTNAPAELLEKDYPEWKEKIIQDR